MIMFLVGGAALVAALVATVIATACVTTFAITPDEKDAEHMPDTHPAATAVPFPYAGWGSAPMLHTSDWINDDPYVNPAADMSTIAFVAETTYGPKALRFASHTNTDWNSVNNKAFVGPLLRADNFPAAPDDVFVRVRLKLPAEGTAAMQGAARNGFLLWEFESYPFTGPPHFAVNLTDDPAMTNDGSYVHWYAGLDDTHPDRYKTWIGPRVQWGRWVDFGVHYVVSKDPSVGGAQLWFGPARQMAPQKLWSSATGPVDFLHFATLVDGRSNLGPHRLVLCEYLGPNVLTQDFAVRYASPVFGRTLADITDHTYIIHNLDGSADASFTTLAAAMAAAQTLAASNKGFMFTVR